MTDYNLLLTKILVVILLGRNNEWFDEKRTSISLEKKEYGFGGFSRLSVYGDVSFHPATVYPLPLFV